MHMEHRKPFQWAVGLLAFALATALYLSLCVLLPSSSLSAALALMALYAGSIAGFERFLVLVLPLFLARLFPSLDAERS